MSLILGTAQFGLNYGVTNTAGQVSFENVCAILDKAWDGGIHTLDTAKQYGNAEEVLGKATHALGKHFNIFTKTRHFKNVEGPNRSKQLVDDFNVSRQLLGDNKVSGLLFHDADDLLDDNGDLFATALQLKDETSGFKIGVSVYDPASLLTLIDRYPIEVVQFPFNLLDQRFLEVLPTLDKLNIQYYARSVFLQGLIADPCCLPASLLRFKPYFSRIEKMACNNDCSPYSLGLTYALSVVGAVTVGVLNVIQLDQFLASSTLKFTQSILEDAKKLRVSDMDLIDPRLWQ